MTRNSKNRSAGGQFLDGIDRQSLDSRTVGRMTVRLATVALPIIYFAVIRANSAVLEDRAAINPLTEDQGETLDLATAGEIIPEPPAGPSGVRYVVQLCTNLQAGVWVDVISLPPLPEPGETGFYRLKIKN